MCQKRETLASRPPRAASWLRSGALRAQAAVAQGWCHVVGIYSSKFNFQLSFLPWQKPCAWDCRHPAVLMWVIRHDEITDPLVISLRSSSATTVLVVCCKLNEKTWNISRVSFIGRKILRLDEEFDGVRSEIFGRVLCRSSLELCSPSVFTLLMIVMQLTSSQKITTDWIW